MQRIFDGTILRRISEVSKDDISQLGTRNLAEHGNEQAADKPFELESVNAVGNCCTALLLCVHIEPMGNRLVNDQFDDLWNCKASYDQWLEMEEKKLERILQPLERSLCFEPKTIRRHSLA